MALFTVQNDNASLLLPKSFKQQYKEDDLQRWSDECPSLLNEGTTMLSLGREIETNHGHYIDNLYLDGNGTLVVAELKRGKNTRDINAQVIEYGTYADQLTWDDLDKICKLRHHKSLVESFENTFGRNLDMSDKVKHRLLIVTETFDQLALDTGKYLESKGLPLAFIEFTYYEHAGGTTIKTQLVLGSIPEQVPEGIAVKDKKDRASSAYNNWLFGRVARLLITIADKQGWDIKYRINKQSVSFVNSRWPSAYGEVNMAVATWAKNYVSLWLYASDTSVPGFGDHFRANSDRWSTAFPALQTEASKRPGGDTSYFYKVPSPSMNDEDAVNELMNKVEAMTKVLMPIVDEYFFKH